MKFNEHMRNSKQLIVTMILEDREWDWTRDAAKWLHEQHPERSYQTCKRIAKWCMKNGLIKESTRFRDAIMGLWGNMKKVEMPLYQLCTSRTRNSVTLHAPGIFNYQVRL
jgi:hypothetical protein